MRRLSEIPVVESGRRELLETPRGDPVWPVSSPMDRQALTRIANTFSVPLRHAPESHPADRQAKGGSTGVVVYTSRRARRAAELCAHLSRRECAGAAADFDDRCDDIVVVGHLRDVDRAVLCQIRSWTRLGIPVGVMAANDDDLLARQVLARTAAGRLAGTWRGGAFAAPIKTGVASSFLRTPPTLSLLGIYSHSDGVDAFLDDERTICPFSSWDPPRSGPERAPRCVLTGHCHRHNTPVGRARRERRLVDPAEWAAQVVLWYVCQGVLAPDATVSQHYGLASRLVDNFSIGAVVTSTDFIISSNRRYRTLVQDTLLGPTIGEALVRYHREVEADHVQNSLVLFGDPRVTLGRVPLRVTTPSPLVVNETGNEGSSTPLGDLRLLQRVLDKGTGKVSERLRPLLLEAKSSLEECRGALKMTGRIDEQVGRVQRAFLRYLAAGGQQEADFDPVSFSSSVRGESGVVPCHICGRIVHQLDASMGSGGGRRCIRICARCGVIQDAPLEAAFSITVSGQQINATVPQVMKGATGAIYLKSWHRPESTGFLWPRIPDQALSPTVVLPRLPIGQLRLYCYIMQGLSLSIATCPLRGM